MNRIDRLTAIILLLQSGKRTANEIAHRFEVSKRTAFRDIQALCEIGVPIVTEAGAHGGYTLMPDYSLAPLQLTLREALLLRNERLEKAQDFIWRNARLLERTLFTFLFASGSMEAVLSALRAYQNEDGGFGNALEPDIRCPSSQPQDIEIALHILDAVDGMHAPMVERACNYLTTITTADGGVPYALPSVNLYPHAPWWTVEENPPASLNPTAAIAGLLLKHDIRHPWIETAAQFCWREIAALESTEFHTLMPVITFLEYAPDRTQAEPELERIAARLSQAGIIELDPQAEGYTQKPLDWVPSPQSFGRRLFNDEIIERHLTALATRQMSDGGWPISWEPLSAAVEAEWRGRSTIEVLRTLDAYERSISAS